MKFDRLLRTLVLMLLFGPERVRTAEPADDPAGIAFFEAKIRPLLIGHCYQCHSAQTGKSEGGLQVDSREAIRTGGDRGPAVVPGKPEDSLLLTAISHKDSDLLMPPKQDRLPAAMLRDVEAWIKRGAPDPRVAKATVRPPVDFESGRKFWALQKPVDHPVPEVKDTAWARRTIDHFVRAKLEAADLAPSPDAEPAVLVRRLHFDLIGLPPTPAEIDAFVQAASGNQQVAIEALVDRLLDSPQFGERWGRHWLDVARFAESSGKDANISFPYAWRYRDYVIDCINADLPYDQFLKEQIAGDLLPNDTDAQRARLLIATGFLAVGPKNLEEGNAKQFAADVVDEQIDTLSRAVLANSVACARCHDHKFDPFAMEDYYALAGIFASTKTYFGTFVSPANRVAGDPLPLPRGAGVPILHESISPKRVEELKAQLAKLKQEKVATLTDALRVFWVSGGIEGQLEKVDEQGQALPLAMGVLEADKIVDAPLLDRGDVGKPGKLVPRHFPQIVPISQPPQIPSQQSGRLELAHWLTHPENPLTARVMANRIWRYVFGAGIVRSTDNFGFSGERPSHPELLDHLAVRFVAQGWSIKKLVRELATSRTYRQASTYCPEAFRADPENRLLWRTSKRRLDAEEIRDAMLVASGELDLQRPEGSLVGKQIGDRPISLIGLDSRLPADLDGTLHRSVYLPILRDRLPDVLDLFDFAEPSLVTGDRESTNVPVQALYLMNSPFVLARAKGLAERVRREATSEVEQVRRSFRLCFGRSPDAQELQLGVEYLKQAGEAQQDQVLASYCQALLATAEFRNLD